MGDVVKDYSLAFVVSVVRSRPPPNPPCGSFPPPWRSLLPASRSGVEHSLRGPRSLPQRRQRRGSTAADTATARHGEHSLRGHRSALRSPLPSLRRPWQRRSRRAVSRCGTRGTPTHTLSDPRHTPTSGGIETRHSRRRQRPRFSTRLSSRCTLANVRRTLAVGDAALELLRFRICNGYASSMQRLRFSMKWLLFSTRPSSRRVFKGSGMRALYQASAVPRSKRRRRFTYGPAGATAGSESCAARRRS